MILFLDLATRTGWAHDGESALVPTTGLIASPHPTGNVQTGYSFGSTFSYFRARLGTLVHEVKPEIVGFEAILPYTMFILQGMAAVTEMVCHDLGVPCEQIHLGTIKKFFAGSGKAVKSDMIARCVQLGWDIGRPRDHNRADAAAGWATLTSMRQPKGAVAMRLAMGALGAVQA